MSKSLQLCISTKCQLGCAYCATGMNKPAVQRRPTIFDTMGVDEYLQRISPIIERYNPTVTIGGPGEPTMAPEFEAIARAGRKVQVYTNGLRPVPVGVSVGVGYHVSELSAGQRSVVRRNVTTFLDAGCSVKIMAPLAPPVLWDDELEADLWVFVEQGAEIALIDLGHVWHGKPYPESYTDAELERIDELRPWGTYRELPKDIRQLRGALRLKGTPCRAPAYEVSVGLTGDIWTCGPAWPRGTVYDYDIDNLYESGPVPCPFERCVCKTLGMTHANR